MAHKHLVQDGTSQLQKFNLDAEQNKHQGIEYTAAVKVGNGEALVSQLLYFLILQLHQVGNRDDLV